MIPKQENLERVSIFRRLRLCNVTYKFISKLLANTLGVVLPTNMSPLQSAFVPKRDIDDGISVAQEILSMFPKN